MAKISVPFVRSPYNYDSAAASIESGLCCQDDSLAQQNFKDECDINTIVNTFARTGELPSGSLSPQFGDFTNIRDFHSALNSVLAAQEAFMTLDPAIRARFDNDPQNLMDFLSVPENRTEAEELGLVVQASPAPEGAAARAKRPSGVGAGGTPAKPTPEASGEAVGGE